MKNITLQSIRTILTSIDAEKYATEIAELDKELNRGAERKQATADAYEAMHDVIVSNLSETPVTLSELFEAIEGELPECTTKGKVQYALTRLWQDEIVKVDGKPMMYKRA